MPLRIGITLGDPAGIGPEIVRSALESGKLANDVDYKVIGHSDNYYLLEVNPQTGRHHQIRVQLAAIGCPIKGDLKYGFTRSNADGSIHLHARKIEFIHPVRKEPIALIAEVPEDSVWKFFEKSI